ncbi:transglutaminase domain-containing protein [Candidatus Peregrinibacteria bacterium]|nr:transglutaminase domain-containing protein [Candidatus Peregrinibacteria bacterium]
MVNENTPQNPEKNLQNTVIFDMPVVFSQTGKKLTVEKDIQGRRIIKINTAKYKTPEEANQAAYLEAATFAAVKKELSTANSAEEFIDLMKENPLTAKAVMRLKAISYLKTHEPEVAEEAGQIIPTALTLKKQFDWLCQQYLLTGKFPQQVLEEIKTAASKLLPDGKRNVLDFIVQENRSYASAVELYQKYVKQLVDGIKADEEEVKKTERDDYVPPPFSSETEPLDPNTVRFKVSPFLGGYYRGQVFRYDPKEKRLVAGESTRTVFDPQEIPENIEDLQPYNFSGIYIPGEENIIPLRKDALPLPATIKPAETFILMRSKTGVFSLEPKKGRAVNESTPFEFTFVLAQTADNRIDDEPEDEDLAAIDAPLGEQFEAFREKLAKEKLLSPKDKARATVAMIRKTMKYPAAEQRQEMDSKYLAAGAALMPTIEEHTITNCHWSNIAASEINKRLEIPSRVPTGFFVQRHPDVDFAPIGGIGHAWSEVWDADQPATKDSWVQMDATPAKENEENDEKEKSDGGQATKANETDNTDQLEEGEGELEESGVLDLTPEELAQLQIDLQGVEPLQTDIAEALFKARTNVNAADWKKVKEFIDAVNKTQVPMDAQIPETPAFMQTYAVQINAPKGTLEREWQKLFCLICKNRAIKTKAFRGPVRQSEGIRLRDPVDAYIDIMSGDPDPGGYEMEATRNKNILDITEFDEDAIIDLTSSMDDVDKHGNTMRVEQKKAILTLLYQIMRLNERLNDSRAASQMREPVTIKSTVYSIHGGKKNKGNYACLKSADEQLTEEVMVNLAGELDVTTPGVGDLLSALKKYREGITAEMAEKLKSGKFIKLLTIYSDGNLWCSSCGHESCNVEMHRASITAIQKEVQTLRAMGVVVQGIGFTENARSIRLICEDSADPESAIVVDNVSESTLARQKNLVKHLKKL